MNKTLTQGMTVVFGSWPFTGKVLHVLGRFVAVKWSDSSRPYAIYDIGSTPELRVV